MATARAARQRNSNPPTDQRGRREQGAAFARHSFPRTLPQSADVEGVSADWISSQLSEVQRALEEKESLKRSIEAKREREDEADDNDRQTDTEADHGLEGVDFEGVCIVQRLAKLEGQVESLALAADFVTYRWKYEVPLPSTLGAELRQCTALADVLTKHEPSPPGSQSVYRMLLEWYERLQKYVRTRAILSVRKALRKCKYPAAQGCDALSDELAAWVANNGDGFDEETFASSAAATVKLQLTHDHLMRHIGRYDQGSHIRRLDLIDELCRPIVKRVRFLFLDEGISDGAQRERRKGGPGPQGEPVRSTGSRLDCLPQWLFHYMNDIISEGPCDFLREDLQPLIDGWIEGVSNEASENDDNDTIMAVTSWHEYEMSTAYFLTEMVKVSQHVLRARKFFADTSTVGRSASPVYLSNAIEQLLMFDSFVSKLLIEEEDDSCISQGKTALCGKATRNRSSMMGMMPPRLIDKFIASNEILMQWWVSVDKQFMLSTLTATTSGGAKEAFTRVSSAIDDAITTKLLIPLTAETFVSLLHSARSKADAIGIPDGRREYIAKAVVPLCMHFMDVMHEQASTMRDLLVQRRKGGAPPTDDDLTKNFLCWIEVVTGTHLAAVALLHGSSGAVVTLGADEDLSRVGRSLERLRDAMVDECSSSFVETILSERAKLASYLMRCPHMLSSRSASPVDQITLSPDLSEAAHVLSVVLKVCGGVSKEVQRAFGATKEQHDTTKYRGAEQGVGMFGVQEMRGPNILGFAPNAIKNNLARRLEEKLLEVALDIHGMIPVVGYGGAEQFRHDMKVIVDTFGSCGVLGTVPSLAIGTFARLIDVTTFMAMEKEKFSSLRQALCGLVRSGEGAFAKDDSSNEHLVYDSFEADGTLLEEAKSMLSAKGFPSLEVEDAVSIMNRRSL